MPITDQITDEYNRLKAEGENPILLRITEKAFKTMDRDFQRFNGRPIPSSATFFGMPIEKVEDGSLDDPCWQLMVANNARA